MQWRHSIVWCLEDLHQLERWFFSEQQRLPAEFLETIGWRLQGWSRLWQLYQEAKSKQGESFSE
jgi:hypothetical protein